jgi:hypothetical protein
VAAITAPTGTQQTSPWYMQGSATSMSMAEIRSRARRLLSSDTYLTNLETALIDRTISPQVEVLLYHYAYGKPQENVNVNHVVEDLSTLTTEQLHERAAAALTALDEARAIEDALDASFTKVP